MVLGEAGPRALDVGFCRVRVSKGSAKKGAFIVGLGFGDFFIVYLFRHDLYC